MACVVYSLGSVKPLDLTRAFFVAAVHAQALVDKGHDDVVIVGAESVLLRFKY